MNAADETDLERAERHVAQAEERCIQQLALVRGLAAAGQDTTNAANLLVRLEQAFELMRQHQQCVMQRRQSQS